MNSVTQEQRKWAAIGILVLSVVIVIVGVRGVSDSLRSSVLPEELRGGESFSIHDEEEVRNEVLRALDTDGDGLNDFEELNLYTTSPYLADSDSDGRSDSEEVAEGDDPNCPGSQDCYNAITAPLEPNTEAAIDVPSNPGDLVPSDITTELRAILPENPSATEIRALFLENGVSPQALSELSDEELLRIYREAYNAL